MTVAVGSRRLAFSGWSRTSLFFPAELPWQKGAAQQSTQWPPGGEPIIRVIDNHTVAVVCDSGMIPSGKLLPPDYKPSREFQGRVQVRFFRREMIDAQR